MNTRNTDPCDLRVIESFGNQRTWLHAIDPRIKLVTTLVFIITVLSCDKENLSSYALFFIYPAFLIFAGRLSWLYFIKRMLRFLPFVIVFGIFNPLIDRDAAVSLGSITISRGWISFCSLLIRFFLTGSSALLLVALSGFNTLCSSCVKMGVPRVFVVQLFFVYQYLFLLTDEVQRMDRARSLRSSGVRRASFRTFVSMIGQLLVRTLDRAERIYQAMCCRGFDGVMPLRASQQISQRDVLFLCSWVTLFVLFRIYTQRD